MFSCALLLNSSTMEEVLQHLKHMYTVFESQCISDNVQESLSIPKDDRVVEEESHPEPIFPVQQETT